LGRVVTHRFRAKLVCALAQTSALPHSNILRAPARRESHGRQPIERLHLIARDALFVTPFVEE